MSNGGHNAGVVSEPGHAGRRYRIATRAADGRYLDPDVWLTDSEAREGSWWPAWTAWLAAHSGAPVAALALGAPDAGYAVLCDAPGSYVRMR
jgi:polyhydroxyalkanoate synthase